MLTQISASISNEKTILILGNSLVEPINTKQFCQEYDLDKSVENVISNMTTLVDEATKV